MPDRRKFQKELNAGTLSLILLATLARARRPMYGYEIARHLEAKGEGTLPSQQGALYAVLRYLEKRKLLASRMEPSDRGPPRRYYSITAEGRTTLPRWIEAWTDTRDFVDTILEGFTHGRSHRSLSSRAGARASRPGSRGS